MSAHRHHEETTEFWPFSLEVYRRPGVEEACLALQDDFGLDVNCLLFCCWAGACGYGQLDSHELAAVVKLSNDWNVAVVQPLRAVRRALKTKIAAPEGPEAQLRQAVKDVELEAEWHEQRLLSDLLERSREGDVSRQAALHNLTAYKQAVGVDAGASLDGLLEVLLDAAFPN